MMMNETLIRARNLYKIYANEGVEVAIIKGISLNIRQTEKLVIIGSSGSGKTTLMNMLVGNIKPNAGQVFWEVNNTDISKLASNKLISLRRNFIGYVSQYNELLPQITVRENIILAGQLAKIEEEELENQLLVLTDLLNITDLLEQIPDTLSEGEKKRVNIAASLITSPRILIADEIVEGLDPVMSEVILDLIDRVNKELNTTIILTTHDQLVAQRGTRIVELEDGVLSGAHNQELNLADLKQTRNLVVDSEGRIRIPPEILQQIGNPDVLTVNIENESIVLSPTENRDFAKEELFECLDCGTISGKIECPSCGSKTIKMKS